MSHCDMNHTKQDKSVVSYPYYQYEQSNMLELTKIASGSTIFYLISLKSHLRLDINHAKI